jgi:von Willebrand factor type A domain
MNPAQETEETDIYFLVDESGSMEPRRKSLVSGINEVIQKQKKVGGACRVSLFFFNEEVREAYRHKPLEEVPMLTEDDYSPDCMTALRDAMGYVLDAIATTTTSAPNRRRVLLLVLTDGEENASMAVSVRELRSKLDQFQGQVSYMGSNQDAILHGRGVGASRGSSLEYADEFLGEALDSLGNAVARVRSGETEVVQFTDLERGRSSGMTTCSQ